MFENIKKEIQDNRPVYFLLSIILALAAFVRVYRTDVILQFFYDQGRDALHIWDLIHKGDFFLIGPTTGIAGIFRGPAYYYLITPFYFFGGGNPVWPANFLALSTVFAIAFAYFLGFKFRDRSAGIIAAILASFSFYLMLSSRWLSNPTPMFLLSMLFIFSLYKIMNGYKNYWILLSLVSGLSLFHFGSSGEFFYFPAIFIFTLWQRKNFPSWKILLASAFVFLLTVSPLVIFDFKNNHLLANNISSFLFKKESFKTDFLTVLYDRLDFYEGVFWGKIFPSGSRWEVYLKFATGILFLLNADALLKNKYFKLVSLVLLSVTVGLLFFQGNEGNIYDYYLTGYYLIFIIFLSLVLREISTSFIGKLFLLFFFFIFLKTNLPIINSNINDGADGPQTIAFKPQVEAINWIYQDAGDRQFNVDVYVPPVIPYAYDYLLAWKQNPNNSSEQVDLLYTLYEVDPPHPERLEAWLARQKGIGEIEETKQFSGIYVQRRKRI